MVEHSTRSSFLRRRRWPLPLGLGVAIGLLLSLVGLMPTADVDIRWSVPVIEAREYSRSASRHPGSELVFVYIGGSTCGWSNVPELPRMVKSLKRHFQSLAIDNGMQFSAVGIARDTDPYAGWEHLLGFGEFDEVMTGRNWGNIGVQKYIYGDMPGVAATPQILLVTRTIDTQWGHVSFVNEEVIGRHTGLTAIEAWADDGAPLVLGSEAHAHGS